MTGLKQTIAKLFATATETGTVEQVSAQAVVAAQEVDPAEDSTEAGTAATEEATPEETTEAAPVENTTEPTAVSSSVAGGVPHENPAATMAHIEVSALAELQRKATAYDGIHPEYTQLKAWHTAAQGGIGLGPDANMATEKPKKHISAATRRAIEIADEQAKYAQ